MILECSERSRLDWQAFYDCIFEKQTWLYDMSVYFQGYSSIPLHWCSTVSAAISWPYDREHLPGLTSVARAIRDPSRLYQFISNYKHPVNHDCPKQLQHNVGASLYVRYLVMLRISTLASILSYYWLLGECQCCPWRKSCTWGRWKILKRFVLTKWAGTNACLTAKQQETLLHSMADSSSVSLIIIFVGILLFIVTAFILCCVLCRLRGRSPDQRALPKTRSKNDSWQERETTNVTEFWWTDYC